MRLGIRKDFRGAALCPPLGWVIKEEEKKKKRACGFSSFRQVVRDQFFQDWFPKRTHASKKHWHYLPGYRDGSEIPKIEPFSRIKNVVRVVHAEECAREREKKEFGAWMLKSLKDISRKSRRRSREGLARKNFRTFSAPCWTLHKTREAYYATASFLEHKEVGFQQVLQTIFVWSFDYYKKLIT